MIAIIDYDMGNLRSVEKAFLKLGCDARITRDRKVIDDASHVVLPGVGAFKDCVETIRKYNLDEAVLSTIKKGKPFLGICVGLQVLFEKGYEGVGAEGLGILKGDVKGFEVPLYNDGEKLKVPHMGWNKIKFKNSSPLFDKIDEGSYFYFVHSFFCDTTEDIVTATCDYGKSFTASVQKDNIFATQFHPEKSATLGLKLLENFTKIK